MQEPHLRLLCHDGEIADLLGELALHKLDLVISDRIAPSSPGLRFYSHPVGVSSIAWYATPALAKRLRTATRRAGGFAPGLARSGVPVLLPTGHGVLRARLDQWFERHACHPPVAGEFEDSALLKTFGASGMGVFPAATLVEDDLTDRYGVERVGDCEGVEEQFFAITPQKKVAHRLVQRITG
jgi:LysR family transcriptional activator of nhaA